MSKASIGGMALQQRLVFSGALLRVPRAQAVFWPGCALLKLDPVILEKTMAVLSRQEPEIALATGCCGQPSAFLFPEKAAARREKLAGMLKKQGVRRIYTACPNCAKEMARLEGIEVIPIWAPLGRNLRAEDLAGTPGQFVLHDPCPMKNDPQRLNVIKIRALTTRKSPTGMSASGNGCTFSVKWACQVSGSGNPLKKSIQNRKVMLLYR